MIGYPFADYRENVFVPYDSLQTLLREGKIDSKTYRASLRQAVPDWYPGQIETMGGVGLTAPGRTARTTFNLGPGIYVMECYAQTPERRLHAVQGMTRPLVVTGDSTGASPPTADLTVGLSKLEIQADSTVPAGLHTVAVRFGEKRRGGPYGHLFQHLHLARLGGETSPQELGTWMTLDPVMPAPVEFAGGIQDMPTGKTAYLEVDLQPGRYAWVLGGPPEQGMVKSFTVE